MSLMIIAVGVVHVVVVVVVMVFGNKLVPIVPSRNTLIWFILIDASMILPYQQCECIRMWVCACVCVCVCGCLRVYYGLGHVYSNHDNDDNNNNSDTSSSINYEREVIICRITE